MKYLLLFIIVTQFAFNVTEKPLEINIIPLPNSVDRSSGFLELSRQLTVNTNSDLVKKVVEQINQETGGVFTLRTTNDTKADIRITLDVNNEESESYKLQTTPKGILIEAESDKGTYYALQSLRQMILFSEIENEKIHLPVLTIEDEPRFGWRGLMLDESRYFFGTEKVKQLLDIMAMHKLNVFHWHLTDVPGWRIEIKQYPKLTTVGGIGNDIDPEAPAKFYTQEEIKEIVQYASDRYIQVIPEIDMPGHAKAANMAYPEFSGGGSKTHPEFTFNPGYPGTYTYLTNILSEVTDMFPAEYIHLGGDEVHFGNHAWNTNPHVQKLMKDNGLNDLKDVEAYFIHRMADSIKMLNKTVIGWDEIVDHELPSDNSVVMWWRHNKPESLESALTKNYNVILCPRIPLYFDFDQAEAHQYGRKWKSDYAPVDMVYHFPPDTLPAFKEKYNLIKGLQANIWTERIQDTKRLDFMTHPRLSALAEASWTNNKIKNYESFKQRLMPVLEYFDKINVNYFNPFTPELTPEPVGLFKRNLKQKRR